MKKIMLFISLFFTSIIVANAELCVHITGDGTKVGDEIACGTEHFYVISNDGENIRMMAKYNLYVGNDFYRVDFNTPYTSENDIYFNKNVQERVKEGYEIYDWIYEYDIENDKYLIQGVILYKDSKYKTQNKYIFFEETKTIEEILKDNQVKEYLNDGYILDYYDFKVSDKKYIGVEFYKIDNYNFKTIIFEKKYNDYKKIKQEEDEVKTLYLNGYNAYQYINNTNNESIGIIMYQKEGYEFKTIFFDKTRMINKDFYYREDVQKYLNEGYRLLEKYDEKCLSILNDYTYCDTYGATFEKSEEYDNINIIFNQSDRIIGASQLQRYLDQNEMFDEYYYEKGYNVETYYRDVLNQTGSSTYYYYGVLLRKYIGKNTTEFEELKEPIYQDETAIGATNIERGEVAPFENGVIYSDNMSGYFSSSNETYDTGFRDYEYYESEYEGSAYYYINTYKDTLINDGYEIIDVDVITVSEINDLVYKIAGKKIPLNDWYEDGIGWRDDYATGNEYYVLGSIKDLMPEGYEWLWGTTYWTRTADPEFNNIYFVDTLGDLCSNEYCGVAIGAGIRPIVTIKADDVVYKIDTITDGHGTVKADYIEAKEGTVVKFTVEPMEGYVLGEVKVTDANGNVVIFTDYTFTMPDANVTIEATFIKIDNPNTMTYISVIVVIGLMISGAFLYKSKKKIN